MGPAAPGCSRFTTRTGSGAARALTEPAQAAASSSPRHRATSCTLGSSLPRGRRLPSAPKSWEEAGKGVRGQGHSWEGQHASRESPPVALLPQKSLLGAEGPRVLLWGGPLQGGSWHPGWRDSCCAPKTGQSYSFQGARHRWVVAGGWAQAVSLTALALLWPRRRWRSCTRCSCCWHQARPRAVICSPRNSTSFSCSSSAICFSCTHGGAHVPMSTRAVWACTHLPMGTPVREPSHTSAPGAEPCSPSWGAQPSEPRDTGLPREHGELGP